MNTIPTLLGVHVNYLKKVAVRQTLVECKKLGHFFAAFRILKKRYTITSTAKWISLRGSCSYIVSDDCSKLAVQMRAEPVVWLQVMQQLFKRRTAQRPIRNFLPEMLFSSQQSVGIAKVVNASRPVVRDENVEMAGNLKRISTRVKVTEFRNKVC